MTQRGNPGTSSAPETDYRGISLWMDEVDDDLTPRASLPGDIDADVAIVGAGYTGLWTAYYLVRSDPHLRVVVLEKEIAGFGASGRNGGWCSALFAAGHEKVARHYGREAAVVMSRAMIATIDEVGRVLSREGIDAGFEKAGTLTSVTSPTQLERVQAEVDEARHWGFGEDDVRWLTQNEARAVVNVRGSLGAAFTPHCAVVQPAALVRGLARCVERKGASIYEHTPVLSIDEGSVMTTLGRVKSPVVVRATEGYTPSLRRSKRVVSPIYSLMIATEPLPQSARDEIGWNQRVTLTDGRHLLIYAQRTIDGRIAIGGRGAPYHFSSRVEPSFDRDASVFADLRRIIGELFPPAADAAISHRWGGPIGVPRDWFSSVGFDRSSGFAWAGGYVGDGVSTTNLAGRTLTALILEQDRDETRLPWVGHRSRRWEPEPLRWLGINSALKMFEWADRAERRRGKRVEAPVSLVKKLVGI